MNDQMILNLRCGEDEKVAFQNSVIGGPPERFALGIHFSAKCMVLERKQRVSVHHKREHVTANQI
jgi:hypothetical protein